MKHLKYIAFILILILLLVCANKIFHTDDERIYRTYGELYNEPNNSLDCVYIGNSSVYAYFESTLAFKDYGFTIYPLSIPEMPVESWKYMLIEARKKQKDAVFLVSLSGFDRKVTPRQIHFTADFMKPSVNKINMIHNLVKTMDDDVNDGWLEFYFPFIRFHSDWKQMFSDVSEYHTNVFKTELKNGQYYSSFIGKSVDVAEYNKATEKTELPDEDKMLVLQDFLTYCTQNNVRVLFVMPPRVMDNTDNIAVLNYVKAYLEEQGYAVADMYSQTDNMDIDMRTDYYNSAHTNIHGAIKYTAYLSKYLADNYDFTDKRNDPEYESWNAAASDYIDLIAPYAFDFEIEHKKRNFTSDVFDLTKATARGTKIELQWEDIDGYEEYYIYRKKYEDNPIEPYYTAWELVDKVKSGQQKYTDEDLEFNVKYTYVAVPVTSADDGNLVYGTFNYSGKTATTLLNAPKLSSLTENYHEITLKWEPVKDAESYNVYRKIIGEEWFCIAEGVTDSEYTDTQYIYEYPYAYSVSVQKEIDNKEYESYYSRTGLVRDVPIEP